MTVEKAHPKLAVVPPAAAAASAAPTAPARSTAGQKAHLDAISTVIACAIPLVITAWGWSYYTARPAVRLRHSLHALLRPSGAVGLSLGYVALALFLFMWLYPMRKKVAALAWTGSVGSWMRVHIVAGLAIPLLAAAHAGWHFEGFIGLGYLSMLIVSLSGVVGRYVYVHIPRSRNGLELSMEEVSNERRALITTIAAATGLVPADIEKCLAVDRRPYAGLDPVRTMTRMFKDDLARGRAIQQLERECRRPHGGRQGLSGKELRETMRLARREMALTQQVRMLDASHTVFGYWHIAHRPFAITAFLAVAAHVLVAVAIGGAGTFGAR